MVFSLPYHVARFFRPTFLDVFSLTNTALGDAFALYGVLAMLSYFPGGAIADRFSARRLMTTSLLATALGGLYMAQIPDDSGLTLLYGYWGITSVLLFWAAMIKATRDWGGSAAQGRAFGILDGGRGLVAAAVASLAVVVFGFGLPENVATATEVERTAAIKQVIYLYTAVTVFAAVLVWKLIPESSQVDSAQSHPTLEGLRTVLGQRVVWLQSVIVICAYCGFKGTDFYALYAAEILNMNELQAAEFVSSVAYLRPVAALAAGLLVDRFSAVKVILGSFLILGISYILLWSLSGASVSLNVLYANIVMSVVGIYALRGVYFALLEETRVAGYLTGTAVGLISVVGYLPDIFFAPVAGRLLDASPGFSGYQDFFAFLTFFVVVGMLATLVLAYSKKSTANT